MRSERLGALTVLLIAAFADLVSAECLPYEPDQVELAGTLVSELRPGPPNRRQTEGGDRLQPALVLVLDTPICTRADASSQFDPHQEIERIQISYPLEELSHLLDRRVIAYGGLFEARRGSTRLVVMHISRVIAVESLSTDRL